MYSSYQSTLYLLSLRACPRKAGGRLEGVQTFARHAADARCLIENCRYSAGRSGYEIARAIEQIALEYGTVSDFNAYLDMQFCALPAAMRSELQSSGVALVDCPHNGQKDVVDQMLQSEWLAPRSTSVS